MHPVPSVADIHIGHSDPFPTSEKNLYVVVVYHVTIVAIGHGLLKKLWSVVKGCVLRTAGSFIIW